MIRRIIRQEIHEAGHKFRREPTPFELDFTAHAAHRAAPYSPFASLAELEIAKWILDTGVSQRATNKLLGSQMVRHC